MLYAWQSESTDGPKGGWNCVFWSGCTGQFNHNCSIQHDIMWCSSVVVVIAIVIVVVVDVVVARVNCSEVYIM